VHSRLSSTNAIAAKMFQDRRARAEDRIKHETGAEIGAGAVVGPRTRPEVAPGGHRDRPAVEALAGHQVGEERGDDEDRSGHAAGRATISAARTAMVRATSSRSDPASTDASISTAARSR
jgi:hypothetical protein